MEQKKLEERIIYKGPSEKIGVVKDILRELEGLRCVKFSNPEDVTEWPKVKIEFQRAAYSKKGDLILRDRITLYPLEYKIIGLNFGEQFRNDIDVIAFGTKDGGFSGNVVFLHHKKYDATIEMLFEDPYEKPVKF